MFALFSRNAHQKELAVNLADGGIDYALSKLNDPAFTMPDPYNVTLTNAAFSSLGEVQISVTTNNSFEKKITSTAYIPTIANQKYKQQIYTIAAISNNSQTVTLSNLLYASNDTAITGSYIVKSDVIAAGNLSNPSPSVPACTPSTDPKCKQPATVCGNLWSTSMSAAPYNVTIPSPPPCPPPGVASNPYPTTHSCSGNQCPAPQGPDIDRIKQNACGQEEISDPETCPTAQTCPAPYYNAGIIGPRVFVNTDGTACNLLIQLGGGDELIKGDIWVTGTLTINNLKLKPDGCIYNSSSKKSPSIVVGGGLFTLGSTGGIFGNSGNCSETIDKQFTWIISESTFNCLNINIKTNFPWNLYASDLLAIFYCPNGTVTIPGPGYNTLSSLNPNASYTSGGTSIYHAQKIGGIISKNTQFTCQCPTSTPSQINYLHILNGPNTSTILSSGSTNAYWLIKRGTYLQKK